MQLAFKFPVNELRKVSAELMEGITRLAKVHQVPSKCYGIETKHEAFQVVSVEPSCTKAIDEECNHCPRNVSHKKYPLYVMGACPCGKQSEMQLYFWDQELGPTSVGFEVD